MSSKQDAHWAKTKSLTFTTLGIWAILSFVIHWFGEGLNSSAFPGAYFMAGMGSQVAFAILVFCLPVVKTRLMKNLALMKTRRH